MEKILQVWNVNGPNTHNKPFIRIQYEMRHLTSESRQRVLTQIRVESGQDPLTVISNKLHKKEFGAVADSETSNDERFLLYFGLSEGRALSLFRTSTYVFDRLINNPKTTLEHVIKEIGSPIHTSSKPFTIGVTGTNGKTTVVNLIYRILTSCTEPKFRVGKIDSLNVEIDSSPIGGIIDEQYDSSRYLLSQDIDAAVLEFTRKGIWFSGLPTTSLSTGIITNISNDHIGTYGVTNLEDLLDIKAVVVRNARNVAVLNYQDIHLRKLGKELKDSKVVYFSIEPADEMNLGDNCIYLDRAGTIVIKSGKQKTPLMSVDEIPFCGYGKISHNVENVLASLAALYFDPNVHLNLEHSSSYLKHLGTNDLIPGRFNQFDLSDKKLIFDYAHNPEGIGKVGESLRRIDNATHSCLISIAESRDLEFCRQMAEKLSEYFNPIYLKETDEECKFDSGITIRDLENSIKCVSPETSVIFLFQNPYQDYMETIRTGETGVILGAGLGNVQEVHELISHYIREEKK